jgi:hypothetical protein
MTRRVTPARIRPSPDCPGCGRPGVGYHRLACRPCWYRLPVGLRRALGAAPGDLALVAEAVQWYRQHPRNVAPR